MDETERTFLTAAEAMERIVADDRVHVFASGPGVLLGADWDRADVRQSVQTAKQIELSGPVATRMGHGVTWIDANGRRWFAATPA